jgi:hypothetical protein
MTSTHAFVKSNSDGQWDFRLALTIIEASKQGRTGDGWKAPERSPDDRFRDANFLARTAACGRERQLMGRE